MNGIQSRLANRAFQGVRRVCVKCKGTCKDPDTGGMCPMCGGVGRSIIREKEVKVAA